MKAKKALLVMGVAAIAFLAISEFTRGDDNAAMRKQIAAMESHGLDDLKSGNYDDFASLTADDAIFKNAMRKRSNIPGREK